MNTVAVVIRGALIFVISLALGACGSGSSSGSSSDPATTPPPSTTPPPTPATAPELSNLAPASISVDLQVAQSSSVNLTFSNSGDAPLTYELTAQAAFVTLPNNASGSLQPNTNATLGINITCGNASASGSLILTTNDADEGSTTIPVTANCTPAPTDLAVARVLMNQGARAFDSNLSATPSIGIIAGREMLVRAFVTGSGTPPEARVVMTVPGQADATYAMQVPPSISSTAASDTTLQANHYVVLPGAAVQENALLRVELAPFANPVTYPASGNVDLDVEDAGTLNVTFVPVTFEGQTPTINTETYIQQALKVLPVGAVDIDVRTPYTFTGTYDLGTLLNEISDLRQLDGSTRLYHAIIIPPASSSSSTAGVGFVGFPVSVSVDLNGTGFVIAHEMGHNLNLGHAPGCGAPGADANYPYADAAIGTWGYDITQNSLVEPTATKRDFMSYCNDLWVSDYHFNRSIEHRAQSAIGFGPQVSAGIVISGLLQNDQIENVQMTSADRLVMHREETSGPADHTFVAWDASGIEVARANFAINSIGDAEGSAGFTLNVPHPSAPIHHYEIKRAGAVLYAQTMSPKPVDPTAVSWQTNGENIALAWSRQAGQALIVKNAKGEIVSVDRSGQISFGDEVTSSAGLSVSLVQSGHVAQETAVISNNRNRVLLTP